MEPPPLLRILDIPHCAGPTFTSPCVWSPVRSNIHIQNARRRDGGTTNTTRSFKRCYNFFLCTLYLYFSFVRVPDASAPRSQTVPRQGHGRLRAKVTEVPRQGPGWFRAKVPEGVAPRSPMHPGDLEDYLFCVRAKPLLTL